MQNSEILFHYFPELSLVQKEQFTKLGPLYSEWNEKINVISRKDIENLYVNHVLHSLGIAKVILFQPGTAVLDVGTGGGFPGIPLAILFPETRFHLVDSIGKKITVVRNVAEELGLKNVKSEQVRAEELNTKYEFIVSRAVTRMDEFYGWVKNKFKTDSRYPLDNGIYYLKGGDVEEELAALRRPFAVHLLSDYFTEAFFETKKVVYIPF